MSAVYKWHKLMEKAARIQGRSFQNPIHYTNRMAQCGFIDIRETLHAIPMYQTSFPNVESLRRAMVENWSMGLEGFSYELLANRLGYSLEWVQMLCVRVRKELKAGSVRGYWLRCVYL